MGEYSLKLIKFLGFFLLAITVSFSLKVIIGLKYQIFNKLYLIMNMKVMT